MIECLSEKNEYEEHESRSNSKYNRKSIEGKVVGCSRCVGYCKYKGHPGFLTNELKSEHNCSEKGCNYYVSKPKKDRNEHNQKAIIIRKILQMAAAATADYEGMRVINISEYNAKECVMRYASISNYYPIKNVEKILSDELGLKVRLDKINCDFDVAAKLIFS